MPTDMRSSKWLQSVFQVIGKEFSGKEVILHDLEKQMSIDTATWGLIFFEQELGIKTDLNKPYEERRAIIKSKRRGRGKVDRALIKNVADAYTNGDVSVTFNKAIEIAFTSVKGIPPNLSDLEEALENIKPAHLRIAYTFIYMTWNQFEGYNKTWDEWEALKLTWDELETYGGE